MMDPASIQAWLDHLFPYFAVLLPTAIGLWNRAGISRVEIQGDGHTTALLNMVKAIDPAPAAEAAAKVLQTAETTREAKDAKLP